MYEMGHADVCQMLVPKTLTYWDPVRIESKGNMAFKNFRLIANTTV